MRPGLEQGLLHYQGFRWTSERRYSGSRISDDALAELALPPRASASGLTEQRIRPGRTKACRPVAGWVFEASWKRCPMSGCCLGLPLKAPRLNAPQARLPEVITGTE